MYVDKAYFLTKIDESELIKLTINKGETAVNETNLAAAINSAGSTIDSYISSVVPLPLTTVPDVIKQVCYDLAVFHLHDRIQYSAIPERVKDKYDAAISLLKDYNSRDASIPGIEIPPANQFVQYEVNPSVL